MADGDVDLSFHQLKTGTSLAHRQKGRFAAPAEPGVYAVGARENRSHANHTWPQNVLIGVLSLDRAMPSTVIKSFEYDPHRRELRIVFQSGRIYRYLKVPAKVAAEMKVAFSKGEYFNAHVRNAFEFAEETETGV